MTRIRKAAPKWTKEDEEKLKKMYYAKIPFKEIAKEFNRSLVAVTLKTNRIVDEINPTTSTDPKIISKIIDDYHNNKPYGKTCKEIGISPKTLKLILKRAGLVRRRFFLIAPKFSEEIVNNVIRLYTEEKMKFCKISKELNIKQSSVRSIISSRNLQKKPEKWTDEECKKLLNLLESNVTLFDICAKLNKSDLQVILCSKFLNLFDKYSVLHQRLPEKIQKQIEYFRLKLYAVETYDKKKFNTDLQLSFEDLFNLYERQSGQCFYTGIELLFKSNDNNCLSIDRIDSSLPHTKDNIVLCTWKANVMKQDLKVEDFLEVAEKVFHRKEKIRSGLNSILNPSLNYPRHEPVGH